MLRSITAVGNETATGSGQRSCMPERGDPRSDGEERMTSEQYIKRIERMAAEMRRLETTNRQLQEENRQLSGGGDSVSKKRTAGLIFVDETSTDL